MYKVHLSGLFSVLMNHTCCCWEYLWQQDGVLINPVCVFMMMKDYWRVFTTMAMHPPAIRVDRCSIYEYFINPSADQDSAAHTSQRADWILCGREVKSLQENLLVVTLCNYLVSWHTAKRLFSKNLHSERSSCDVVDSLLSKCLTYDKKWYLNTSNISPGFRSWCIRTDRLDQFCWHVGTLQV